MANPDFVKGREKEGGRTKGTPNKFTNLKQAFLDVFEKIEQESKKNSDVKSFFQWVVKNDKNRAQFYQLISKMLPSNVKVEGEIDCNMVFKFDENGNGDYPE